MAVTLTLVGKTPGDTQWQLDTFTERYKCDASADDVLTDGSVPQIGDAHPDYATMFITSRYCSETGESASALDLVYMGTLSGTLPLGQSSAGAQVASASSQSGPVGGFALESPVTLQFYAPTSSMTWVSDSEGGYGPSGPPSSPAGDIQIIDYVFAPSSIPFGFSGDLFAFFRDNFFIVLITSVITSQEIVAGQYWTNTQTLTKTLIPFAYLSGANVGLNAAGTGYSVGDSLGISSGGESASMTVTAITAPGGVAAFTLVSSDFTVAHTALSASGGGGSGATFDVFITT